METVLPREIGAPLGHPGRSLRCPRPPRTLRSRRARPDTHERPLLCGRRSRQLLCSRGAPAAEGVEARGGRGGGDRHVLHAIGSVASVGPNGPGALTDGVDHRRPPEALLPPQAEPQPALAVPRTPRTRPRAARDAARGRLAPDAARRAEARPPPGVGSRRHRSPRGRRHLAARHLFSPRSIGASSDHLASDVPVCAGRVLEAWPRPAQAVPAAAVLVPGTRLACSKKVTCEAYFSKRESFLSMVLCLNKIRFVKVQGYFRCLPKVDSPR